MRWFKWTFVFAMIAAVVAVSGWLILRNVSVSVGYGVRAEFEEFPVDDKPLVEWLASQKGVVKAVSSRETGAIRVYWIMTQRFQSESPVPDLRQEFERFGYRRLISYDGNWFDN
jgi:hypothetical protein